MNINSAIAERARAGEPLTAAEIDELATADVLSLGMLADDVRRARVGTDVKYVRVHTVVPDASATSATGATEVRIAGAPEALVDLLAMVRDARASAEGRLLTFSSLGDLIDRGWGTLDDVLRQLKGAGLDAIADAHVDQVSDLSAHLQTCADAGLPVRCLSIQKPITDRRTETLMQVRAIVATFPAIGVFAPLPREQSIAVPTTGYDDVRTVALARLALPSVPVIQVDWTQYGPKLAQVALTFGANELDRVAAVDDESLGRRRTPVEDVRRNIAAAGFTPVERVTPA